MDYLLDASVLVQILITDAQTQHVENLFDSLTEEDNIHIPEFGLAECVNVLWKHVRFHDMTEANALKLVDNLNQLPLVINYTQTYFKRALEIGLQHKLAVYDSIYIAMAEHLKCPLISVDQRQTKVARAESIELKPITDFTAKGDHSE